MVENKSDLETEFSDLWWWNAYWFLRPSSARRITDDEQKISKYNKTALKVDCPLFLDEKRMT